MTFTHEELLSAVREAGRDRESFTCADVRTCLGLTTKDKKQLSRFYSRFRAFQAAAGDEIERVSNNCYRLCKPVDKRSEPTVRAVVSAKRTHRPVRAVVAAASDTLAEREPIAASTPLRADTLSEVDAAALDALTPDDDTIELTDEMLELVVIDRKSEPVLSQVRRELSDTVSSNAASAAALAQGASDVLTPSVSEAKAMAPELPLAAMRTWRDRGQWLGRRFAEMFSRTGDQA